MQRTAWQDTGHSVSPGTRREVQGEVRECLQSWQALYEGSFAGLDRGAAGPSSPRGSGLQKIALQTWDSESSSLGGEGAVGGTGRDLSLIHI